jgi:hypothetical protein
VDVFNWSEETSRKIRVVTKGKVCVVTQEVTHALAAWPADKPFVGGWFDFCGTASRATAALRVMLERKLIADDAAFAVTWCTRDRSPGAFPGEQHQHSFDGEAEIAQLAETAGFAMIKLHGAFFYRQMYYWAFRLRKCAFLDSSHPTTYAQQSTLRECVTTSAEHEVEHIQATQWNHKMHRWEYLLKWKGFEECSWEPSDTIELDCPDAVDEFRKRTGSLPFPSAPVAAAAAAAAVASSSLRGYFTTSNSAPVAIAAASSSPSAAASESMSSSSLPIDTPAMRKVNENLAKKKQVVDTLSDAVSPSIAKQTHIDQHMSSQKLRTYTTIQQKILQIQLQARKSGHSKEAPLLIE